MKTLSRYTCVLILTLATGTGRHLVFQKDTHMSNLLLALLDTLSVKAETFGDSTGMLTI